MDRVSGVHLTLATVSSSFTWAYLNWIADAACLVLAIKAIGIATSAATNAPNVPADPVADPRPNQDGHQDKQRVQLRRPAHD
ncbi:MAG: hypothetical protein ACLPKE_06545, partial [Streptosporangiaceae bacterium]